MGGAEGRPLVVMMHGATMDHRMFSAQVEALLPEYRVLVWDARGHGDSQPSGTPISMQLFAEDMLAILDHLEIPHFVAVGQSLGGYIAQHLVRLVPERVVAMVVIGSTPIAKAYSRFEVWALKATMPLFNLWPYGHFVNVVANNTAVDDAVRRYALDAIRRIPRDEFLRIWKAVTVAVDAVGDPGWRIEIPLLLVHGDQDRTGTIRRDMPIWAQQEPHAEYHVIPNAGHNANQDNPAVTNEILLQFLHKHVPA
jgi:pimeloyl-ACP methyl ester carboxylesterase